MNQSFCRTLSDIGIIGIYHLCLILHAFLCDGRVHTYVHARGSKKLISRVFLNCSPLCILRQGLSLYLEFINMARLVAQLMPGSFLFLSLKHWACTAAYLLSHLDSPHECFACMHVLAPCECLVPKSECWNQSCR